MLLARHIGCRDRQEDQLFHELVTAMGNYNEELVKAGIMLAGDGRLAGIEDRRGRNRSLLHNFGASEIALVC